MDEESYEQIGGVRHRVWRRDGKIRRTAIDMDRSQAVVSRSSLRTIVESFEAASPPKRLTPIELDTLVTALVRKLLLQ